MDRKQNKPSQNVRVTTGIPMTPTMMKLIDDVADLRSRRGAKAPTLAGVVKNYSRAELVRDCVAEQRARLEIEMVKGIYPEIPPLKKGPKGTVKGKARERGEDGFSVTCSVVLDPGTMEFVQKYRTYLIKHKVPELTMDGVRRRPSQATVLRGMLLPYLAAFKNELRSAEVGAATINAGGKGARDLSHLSDDALHHEGLKGAAPQQASAPTHPNLVISHHWNGVQTGTRVHHSVSEYTVEYLPSGKYRVKSPQGMPFKSPGDGTVELDHDFGTISIWGADGLKVYEIDDSGLIDFTEFLENSGPSMI